MTARTALKMLFGFIFLSLLGYTLWASSQQSVWQWQGLTYGKDRWWTLATLLDAYYGFITFFVWVCFKERSRSARFVWFVAIMALGNIAMSAYVLRALYKLKPHDPLQAVLLPERVFAELR